MVAEGGPWTWVSRADSQIRSCLDLVIVSANIRQYVSKLLVDSSQKYCPNKVGMLRGKENMIWSEHYPMIFELKNMPKAKTILKKERRWNLLKPGGWQRLMK